MTLTPEEEFVKAVLESVGAKVAPIEHATDRTPDFQVWFSDVQYIVEVKTRMADEARKRARHEVLRRGEVAVDSETLQRRNTISGIVAWGVDQLDGFGDSSAFRLLWVHAGGPFGERYKIQFFNALYGATRLYDFNDKEFKVHGLYFQDSDFYRYRKTLDGVVITMETGAECQLFFHLNDNSPNYEALKISPLAKAFPIGIYDPLVEETLGEALIVRGEVDRGSEDAVIAHLYKQTGRQLYSMPFTHANASIVVPFDADADETETD